MKGRRIRYSAAELAFVEARKEMPRIDLTAMFVAAFGRVDVSVENISSLCKRRRWSTGREYWTPEEDAQLRDLYPNTRAQDLEQCIGRPRVSIWARAKTLGLRKSEEFLTSSLSGRLRQGATTGVATQFKTGPSSRKGLKRPEHWKTGRMQETQFKKGEISWRTMAIGGERIVNGYSWTKISDEMYVPWTKNWRQTHILRWEHVRGPIPDGHALKSLDGDRRNTDPSNWTAVPRGMLPRLNGKCGRNYDGAPSELKPVIMAIAKLEHAARTVGVS